MICYCIGVHEMERYFILQCILKRVVSDQDAKEMILRFADEQDMETSYAAWRLKTPTPYSIVSITTSAHGQAVDAATGSVH